MRNSTCPASTSEAFSARIAVTVPAVSATIGMKVFIASTMQTVWPASTRAPSSVKGAASGEGVRWNRP